MSKYSQEFLRALKDAGDTGVPNHKLSRIALQYNYEIYILRKAGHDIRKRRVYRDGKASSTWMYHLVEEKHKSTEPSEPTPAAIPWLKD